MKQCSRCKQRKPKDEFSTAPRLKDGLHAWCKKCCAAYQKARITSIPTERARLNAVDKEWRLAHPKEYKQIWWRQYLSRVYGLTVLEYQSMVERQRGCCAICASKRRLFIDHEAGSNPVKVRGLLCVNCNTGIGKLAESPELLRRAAKYLLGKL